MSGKIKIHIQGCRLPHARTPAACWNDVGHIRFTGSQARLACSYFANVQQCRLDLTYQNRTQVNAYCLLLSSFVHFHVRVKAMGNFRPYSSEFVSQHVPAAAISLQQKSNTEKKGKQTRRMKKRKETENDKTPESEQPVAKSVCGSLTMRRRAALATIVCRWMHNLQVGRNQGPRKVHSAWTLH